MLLNQHGDNSFWKFCGGRVGSWDKDLMENAKIKVKEEMGIDIEFLTEKPFVTYAQTEKENELYDVILVHFLAKRIGEIKPGNEIRDWGWFNLDCLPDNLAPNIIPVLKHYKFI